MPARSLLVRDVPDGDFVEIVAFLRARNLAFAFADSVKDLCGDGASPSFTSQASTSIEPAVDDSKDSHAVSEQRPEVLATRPISAEFLREICEGKVSANSSPIISPEVSEPSEQISNLHEASGIDVMDMAGHFSAELARLRGLQELEEAKMKLFNLQRQAIGKNKKLTSELPEVHQRNTKYNGNISKAAAKARERRAAMTLEQKLEESRLQKIRRMRRAERKMEEKTRTEAQRNAGETDGNISAAGSSG